MQRASQAEIFASAPPTPGSGAAAAVPFDAALAIAPDMLHPSLWLAHQLGHTGEQTVASGFAALDSQLPGRGWPRRALTELLLPQAGIGEIRLLSPCLAATQRAGRLVMVFDPPDKLSAWALVQLGIDVEQLLVINTRTRAAGVGSPAPASRDTGETPGPAWGRAGPRAVLPGADSLWALEQALKSGHVGAVVAWLPPRLRAERLRRLQLAAHVHDGVAFVMREMAAQQRPTAAPLRIALRAGGPDLLNLQVLKRRGPPLETPLQLRLPPVLPCLAGRAAQGPHPPSPDGAPVSRALSGSNQPQPAEGLQAATFIDLG